MAQETKRKTLNTALQVRDALPFFKKRRGKTKTSWWNVKPTGDYATDLETGKAYARVFLPMMKFNAGPSDLGVIVSDMALAGRKPGVTKEWRGIDAIALGFLMEIGGNLQAAIAGVAIAATVIESPNSDLGPKFVELVKAGKAFEPLRRNTLFHDPNAHILDMGERK